MLMPSVRGPRRRQRGGERRAEGVRVPAVGAHVRELVVGVAPEVARPVGRVCVDVVVVMGVHVGACRCVERVAVERGQRRIRGREVGSTCVARQVYKRSTNAHMHTILNA